MSDEDLKRRAQAENEGGGEPSPQGALFLGLVSTLAAQAAICLGLEADPAGAKKIDTEQARYLIDVLGMIEDKTRGNLGPEEERHLQAVLHELRLAFVEVNSRPKA